ncbi:MAG: IPT/TIG domain-containing protein [Longimicrobiales bacterium]|nr:IPT/TIG domain-containing protein [Longimicrobiales bacterium]
MSGSGRRAVLGGWLALMGVLAACSNPSNVVDPPLEALVASGDSQYGTANQLLSTPLQVVVRSIVTKVPREGVTVVWTVESGDASISGSDVTTTDANGSARAMIRLGTTPGEVTVRATVQQQNQATTTFRLFLVNRPVLSDVTPATAAPGEAVTLTGQNFSPDPDQNVVLFSGIRGRVTSASETELTVVVPECLPQRSVSLIAQLGSVASESLPFAVGAGGQVASLQVGDLAVADDPDGYECITVPGDGSATYVVMAQSASILGAASHPFTLYGLGQGAPAAANRMAVRPLAAAPAAVAGTDPEASEGVLSYRSSGEPSGAQFRLDRELRTLEREATRGGGASRWGGDPARVEGPARTPPVVGERRTFQVFQSPGNFTEVTAVARFVGARAALFVDEDAPSGGFTQADLQLFSDRFDDFIHPAVTAAFGEESDLDDNDRVVILFSPAVNALTSRGATGFVGGFFFGIDLLPESQGSNGGEVFYTLVPDPDGIFSDPRPKDDILEVVPGVLAHEFQHMVHFNQRVLLLGAEANEALWLSEGLAQYAEEVVARAYEDVGDAEGAELFRDGARERSRRYLSAPDEVSLVISAGQGTLEERGAAFLHVLYLADRFGDGLMDALVRSMRIGVENVEAATGTSWPSLLSDWWAAIRLDGTGAESPPAEYPTVELRSFLQNPFPLTPAALDASGFVESGSLPSSSVAYYEVVPAGGGSMTLRIGGAGGGIIPPQAALQFTVIRVQ